MRPSGKKRKQKRTRRVSAPSRLTFLKKKTLAEPKAKAGLKPLIDPDTELQLRAFEEAVQHFQQQKYAQGQARVRKSDCWTGKELADRARVHLRIIEQRLQRSEPVTPRTPEEHYQQGVAMMNMGRWDEAREHLVRARKLAPKADYVIYAMAALDCLTGEAESAMENLKLAIQLRPENRYHARNDEDFAFLQEDPRFTELLYPDRDGSGV